MNFVSGGLTGVITVLWRALLNNGGVLMIISHLLLHNITSQGNDNASQNCSKWKYKWRKRRTVLFGQNKSYDELGDADDLGRPDDIWISDGSPLRFHSGVFLSKIV